MGTSESDRGRAKRNIGRTSQGRAAWLTAKARSDSTGALPSSRYAIPVETLHTAGATACRNDSAGPPFSLRYREPTADTLPKKTDRPPHLARRSLHIVDGPGRARGGLARPPARGHDSLRRDSGDRLTYRYHKPCQAAQNRSIHPRLPREAVDDEKVPEDACMLVDAIRKAREESEPREHIRLWPTTASGLRTCASAPDGSRLRSVSLE